MDSPMKHKFRLTAFANFFIGVLAEKQALSEFASKENVG